MDSFKILYLYNTTKSSPQAQLLSITILWASFYPFLPTAPQCLSRLVTNSIFSLRVCFVLFYLFICFVILDSTEVNFYSKLPFSFQKYDWKQMAKVLHTEVYQLWPMNKVLVIWKQCPDGDWRKPRKKRTKEEGRSQPRHSNLGSESIYHPKAISLTSHSDLAWLSFFRSP